MYLALYARRAWVIFDHPYNADYLRMSKLTEMLWASRHIFRFCALATMACCRPHPVSPGRRPESPLWVPRRRVWRDDFRVLCGGLVPGTAGGRLLCLGGEPVRPGGPWSACAEREALPAVGTCVHKASLDGGRMLLHLPASAKGGGPLLHRISSQPAR